MVVKKSTAKQTKSNKLEEKILQKKEVIDKVVSEVHKKIIGQDELIETLLIALLVHGHILLEGVPGIAKTLTVDTLARALHGDFKRIQFTPDLLPSDLIGTEIYNQGTKEFEVKKGPIFTNFLLADEINRASSKVQSALLEAMAERQITIGEETHKLSSPFLVLATQNPIEQTGTYRLPEAQLDRFMLKVYVDYPSMDEEKELMQNIYNIESVKIKQIMTKKSIAELQGLVREVYISENILDYINDIIFASREPLEYGLDSVAEYLDYGISPRGSLALMKCSQAYAFLQGRSFVIPEDVKAMAVRTLAHRLVTNYEAVADEVRNEEIIDIILNSITVK